MLEKFLPTMYIPSYNVLDMEMLKKKEIGLLICDVDNTLVPHTQKHADKEVMTFVEKVKSSGITLVLVSNNKKSRVETFAKDLNVKIYPNAKKPLKGIFEKVMQEHPKYKKKEIAILGDQVMTDVFGGNRFGISTILSDPLAKKDLFYTKINRFFERMVLRFLKKKYKFEKGVYYYESL